MLARPPPSKATPLAFQKALITTILRHDMTRQSPSLRRGPPFGFWLDDDDATREADAEVLAGLRPAIVRFISSRAAGALRCTKYTGAPQVKRGCQQARSAAHFDFGVTSSGDFRLDVSAADI